MKHRLFSVALATAAGASTLPAADTQIRDVRLGIAFSIAENAEIELPTQGMTADIDESSVRISLAYVAGFQPMQSWGAFIYGIGADYIRGGGDAGAPLAGITFETTSMGITIQGGYAYGFPSVPALHLEGALQLGYLVQDTNYKTPIGEVDIGDNGFEYGLRASVFYTFPQQWQLGLNVRYIIDRTTKGVDESGPDNQKYTVNGLSTGLSIGHRF